MKQLKGGTALGARRDERVCVHQNRERTIGHNRVRRYKSINALLIAVTEPEECDDIAADDRIGRDDWIRRHEIREVPHAAGNGRVQVSHYAESIGVLSIHADLARIAVTQECNIASVNDWSSVPVGIVGNEIREVATAARNERTQVSYDPIGIGRDGNVNTELTAGAAADKSKAGIAKTKISQSEVGEVAGAAGDRRIQVGHHLVRIARH